MQKYRILPEHIFLDEHEEIKHKEIQQEGSLKENETSMILHALEEGNGSRKRAAEKLGISPRTLRYKLARLKDQGIEIPPAFGVA